MCKFYMSGNTQQKALENVYIIARTEVRSSCDRVVNVAAPVKSNEIPESTTVLSQYTSCNSSVLVARENKQGFRVHYPKDATIDYRKFVKGYLTRCT